MTPKGRRILTKNGLKVKNIILSDIFNKGALFFERGISIKKKVPLLKFGPNFKIPWTTTVFIFMFMELNQIGPLEYWLAGCN